MADLVGRSHGQRAEAAGAADKVIGPPPHFRVDALDMPAREVAARAAVELLPSAAVRGAEEGAGQKAGNWAAACEGAS
ncbi:MAG: hypothetical protein AAGF46_10275 [Pseudomonadota bacterium]